MTLSDGATLSHYKVLEKIGQGGMGEVYRAEDTNLSREVAIKVLPEQFTKDPQRLARFEREAKLLASLNHPNIAAIYGLEEADGVRFLALELVEGETLAERVAKGPVPVEEALEICRQIAEGVEAAHAKGVIHRDLKPANVKVTPEDKVKILDFGLAKAFEEESPAADVSQSPTLTAGMTRAGMILGTAAYMSPEQARGKPVDTRTDVWALGCILYELFTGKQAFPGEDITEIIATVVKGEPDWAALPKTAPTNIRFVLGRCLEKDMNRRFRAVADVGIEIEEALTSPIHPGTTILAAKGLRRAIPLGLAALLAVSVAIAAATVVWYMKPAALPDEAVTRLTVALDQETQLTNLNYPLLALSPDGTQLAYVAIPKQGGVRKLYVRALNSLEARPIPGTEGAQTPFFSPDGQWIGFFAQGKLRKVSVAGGAAQSLYDAPTGLGGAWGPDGTIFFAPFNTSGLFRVSAAGGEPQEATTLKRSEGEISHRWPQVLPGGKAVLFTVWTGPGWEERHIAVQSLETGERKILVQGGTTGRYLPTGHLVFSQGRTLMAVPFDLAGLEVMGGPPVPLAEQVMEVEGAQYTFSASGLLAYLPDNPRWQERRLVWVDREGSIEPLAAPPRPYAYGPRISPDGRQVAVHIEGASWGIWVYDFARATLTRLTSGEASQFPVWTPDGKRIAYRGTRTGFRNLFWMAADGTEVEERLTTSEHFQTPSSWSPAGKWLAFQELTPNTGSDIWVLPLEEGGEPKVFLSTSASEVRPRFSPDGRWLAYQSNESGRDEIYVRPFPGPGGKWQISTEGGGLPFWARNGRELFYINGSKVMAVEITPGSGLTAGVPRLLFERNELLGGYTSRADVSLDGQRFLMIQPAESADVATQINVVLNWFEELKRLVPTN